MKKLSCLLILFIVFSSCSDKKKEIRNNFSAGISAFYKSDYNTAIEKLSKVVESDPKHAEAFYYRGSANFNIRQFDKAIADLDMAVKIRPDYADAYSTKGDILNILGKHDEACECWRKAQDLGKPNMFDKVRRCF